MKRFDEAIKAFEGYLIHHPVDENWRAAQQSIVNTRRQKAEDLQSKAAIELKRWISSERSDDKDPDKEAIPTRIQTLFQNVRKEWEAFQETYPLDSGIPSIQLQLAKNEWSLRNFDEAISQFKDIASRFEKSDQASEALYLIASITEREFGDYEKAIDLYKEVNFGSHENAARRRIQALQEVFLSIRAEKPFRTDEKPAIHTVVRNIENLTCKLYALDLQSYYQSKHTIRNIEDLDVNLIAPDKVWQVTPEEYKQYKESEFDIDIPVEKPGAWVFKAESETLEAVTMLVVSDLAIAMKGGKNEVFVYAEDQRREKTVEGATVYISDGKSIIAQGKTNNDGIYHNKELGAAEVNTLSVFASYEGNWAGEFLNTNGLQAVTSLRPRLVIYTDRPTYQPGDEVNYRALIREIEDGQYVIPTEDFETTVIDARGSVVYKNTNAVSEYGTLSGQFTTGWSGSVRPIPDRDFPQRRPVRHMVLSNPRIHSSYSPC